MRLTKAERELLARASWSPNLEATFAAVEAILAMRLAPTADTLAPGALRELIARNEVGSTDAE